MGRLNIILQFFPCWDLCAGALNNLQHGLRERTHEFFQHVRFFVWFWFANVLDIVRGGPAGTLLAGDTQGASYLSNALMDD